MFVKLCLATIGCCLGPATTWSTKVVKWFMDAVYISRAGSGNIKRLQFKL